MQSSLTDFFSTPRASTLSENVFKEQNSKKTSRKRPRLKSVENNFHQTIIDAGQKNIGLEHCTTCGMVYSLSDNKDVEEHEKFHNRFTQIRNYKVTLNQINTWKKSLYCEEINVPLNGLLFRLAPISTATLKRRFEDLVNGSINEQVGYSNELSVWDQQGLRRALVFVADSVGNNPAFIAGIILIDPIDEVILMPQQRHFKGNFLGVDRIWVHANVRRKGLATFLLDAARRVFSEDRVEKPRTRIAFSDPSELGIKLATNYVGGDKENNRYIIYAPKSIRGKADVLMKKLST